MNYAKGEEARSRLTNLLLTIEAQAGTRPRESTRPIGRAAAMDDGGARKLKDIPVDIRPIFVTADELTSNRQSA